MFTLCVNRHTVLLILLVQHGKRRYKRSVPMATKAKSGTTGNLNIRLIPRDLLDKLKIAAAIERKTVKDVILELAQEKIQDMEKKGLLPKGK